MAKDDLLGASLLLVIGMFVLETYQITNSMEKSFMNAYAKNLSSLTSHSAKDLEKNISDIDNVLKSLSNNLQVLEAERKLFLCLLSIQIHIF